MKTIIKSIALVTALVTVLSCDLDLTPKGTVSYNPGDQFIMTENDVVSFEANILACFRSLEYGVYDMTSDIMMDYFNAASDNGNNGVFVHTTDASFTSSDYDVEANWAYPYLYINNFNIYINGAQSVPAELKESAAIVRGEAYLARAFAYMHLARHFGKAYSSTASTDLCVPIVTAYDQNARPTRATVAEVYGQIKKDLDSAAVLLANVPGKVRATKPTIDAVNAMYARYYLDVQDYENAADAAMSVINSGAGYAVSNSAAAMATEWLNDKGTEPILQFFASKDEGVGGHSYYFGLRAEDGVNYCSPYYIPSQKLVGAYESGDLRLAQWFTSTAVIPAKHNGSLFNAEKPEYYNFTKYYGNPELITNLPNSGQAIKPFLISEMYLIAAEGYFKANNVAAAKTQLNVLQTRRGATATEATFDAIKTEWYRETVGEGLRMSCLKRWGEGYKGREAQAGTTANHIVTLGKYFDEKEMPVTDYHYQWPIPAYEIQTNLNLANQQNDGYGVADAE